MPNETNLALLNETDLLSLVPTVSSTPTQTDNPQEWYEIGLAILVGAAIGLLCCAIIYCLCLKNACLPDEGLEQAEQPDEPLELGSRQNVQTELTTKQEQPGQLEELDSEQNDDEERPGRRPSESL